MTQAKLRFETFEDYLAYDDGGDRLYELFNGELTEVPPESGENVQIANFLFALLLPVVGYRRLRGHGLELEVRGEPRNRYPDLTVIREEHVQQLQRRHAGRSGRERSAVTPAPVAQALRARGSRCGGGAGKRRCTRRRARG